MECSEIQEKLSAFLEGVISTEEKALIEEHIGSCQKCGESLADLMRTVEYVRNLEDIEPPPWLTQKVMARVKAEVEPKKGIFQRLFYPLHIKLPIEIAATIAIAITTIYIFKTIQPEMKFAKAPTKEVAPQIPLLERDTIPPSPPLEKGGKGGFEAVQPVPSKKPEPMDKYAEIPKIPEPVARQDKVMPFAGALAKEEARRETLSAAPKAKALVERKEIISLTINVKDIKTAGKKIENALTELNGQIIKTKSFDNKNVISAEFDSENLRELIDRLKVIGEIKEEVDLKDRKGYIEIRIEVEK